MTAHNRCGPKWLCGAGWMLHFCMCSIALLFVPAVAYGASVSVTYNFDPPQLTPVEIEGQMYTRIVLPGAPNTGEEGSPGLPARGARILIPYGEEVTDVTVTALNKTSYQVEYPIEPVGPLFPLSIDPADIPPLRMNPAVYASPSALPVTRHVSVGVQVFRGYHVLVLQLNPVDYVPAAGVVDAYGRINVEVTTAPAAVTPAVVRDRAIDRAEISGWVDNPADVAAYPATAVKSASAYDMLLITNVLLAPFFEPLKTYHDAHGVLTEIRTLTDIGCSDPHCIRDYIRQEFQNNGITYVLIGGDDNIIPALDAYVSADCIAQPDCVESFDMPGDFYWSCLDGTFNYDGDARWGEPNDGEGGGEIDLFPDVNIGRASAGKGSEVTNFVNKTLAYLQSNDPYLDNILLAGEQLTFAGYGEYGGYAMDEMVNSSDAHGFLTYAFPEDQYTISKLYDVTHTPVNYWYPSEMFAWLNSGVHIVDHLGHSAPHYSMRTDTLDLRLNLHNNQYFFVYAEGCSAGSFDTQDCWAEYMTTVLPTGAFGCIANSRYGLGARSTMHPVHIYNREFWDAIYNGQEAKPELGRALTDARVDHVYHINEHGIRWNYYEINLFGDPAVAIKPVRTISITCPDGLPSTVPPQTETPVGMMVNGIGQGVPVAGSGQLHYWQGDGDTTTVAMTEVSDNIYEAMLPAIDCGGSLYYCFSAEESVNGRMTHPQSGPAHEVFAVTDEIVLFEDDFETDKGWSVSGQWQRGIPQGLGGEELQYPAPDPTEGCAGPQVMGYNLAGDYPNNLPAQHLIGPPIDCTDADNVRVQYCRWLAVEQPYYDEASVAVSNDGSTWTTVWENYATIADLDWEEVTYDISSVAAGHSNVYLRWTMGPTDGGLVYAGWNIDNVQVLSYACETCDCPYQDDYDEDTFVTPLDLAVLIDILFAGTPEIQDPDCPSSRSDNDCDGFTTSLDLAVTIDHLYASGPPPCDPCAP
jgi:hypothetical protein